MATGQQLIDAARKYLGVPYVFGGTTKAGLDCSGLVVRALDDVGARGSFPRVDVGQIAACEPISVEEALRTPGALVWFDGHDALTLGDGKSTIEAVVNPGRAVQVFAAPNRWKKAGLIPGIDYRKQDNMTVRMVSPVEGRVTSEFSASRRNPVTGRVEPHLGLDIAAPGGTPLRAVYAGTVIGVGGGLLLGRSGDRNILIQNPDGERQYYGHCESYSVSKGQQVAIGEVIGTVGQRGNATGPHVHLEIHAATGAARNPRIDFEHWGVVPGSKPGVPAAPPAPKPPAPAVKPKGFSQKTLDYQKRQNKYGDAGLFPDGINGPKTKAWRAWVKRLQVALRPWRGIPSNLLADGDYASVTHNAVRVLQGNNGLFVDGFAQAKTITYMRANKSTVPHRP